MSERETRHTPARWRFEWVLIAAGIVSAVFGGIVGSRTFVWAGGAAGLAGVALVAALPLLGGVLRWLWPRTMWKHQLAQLAIVVPAAAGVYLLGGRWASVVIVVAAAMFVSLDAGTEGREIGRRLERRDQLLQAESELGSDDVEVDIWEDGERPWDGDERPPWEEAPRGPSNSGPWT
jgi:hypothetical protein